MKSPLRWFALIALLATAAHADTPVLQTSQTEVDVGAMVQVMGAAQQVDDPVANDQRLYLFMKEARLRATGRYQDVRLNLELALGGEEAVSTQTGVSLSLLDLNVDLPLRFLPKGVLRVGQFKVPYGREALTSSGDSVFAARSISDLGFRVGRDVGLALTTRPGPLTATFGVFTGGGRDLPQRFLPEQLGVPLFVARVGAGNLDEEDPYALKAARPARGTEGKISLNALFTRDSRVGHSTVFNVKLADKSLLLNPNWNPYLARAPLSQGELWQVGADAVVRGAVGSWRTSGEAEVDWAGYSNDWGVLHMGGLRVKGGVGRGPIDVSLRYAALFPDAHFAQGGAPLTGTSPIHEFTPSLAYRFAGDHLKLVADLPVLLQAPVFTEPNVGAYVGTDLPDQSTVLASGGQVARQNVVEGRLLLQARF